MGSFVRNTESGLIHRDMTNCRSKTAKNKSQRSTPGATRMRTLHAAFRLCILLLLFGLFPFLTPAQQISNQQQQHLTITGTVRNPAGQPIRGAEIQITPQSSTKMRRTTSDAEGRFSFSGLESGTYRISAAKDKAVSNSIVVSASATDDRLQADLVIETNPNPPSPAGQMEFYDQPSFTIAGVTDWTAAGGHGSDAILRTSESLTRDTLALKSGAAQTQAADRDKEERLRAALAAAPESFEANARLGKFYFDHGNYSAAISPLEKAHEIEKNQHDNALALAVAAKETGDLAKARALVAELKSAGETGNLDRLAAEIDERSGNPTAAADEFQRAVRLDPSEQNYFELGSELLLHRAIWQAKQVFEEGVRSYPESARLQTALGTALFAGALYDDAARQFCKASDLNPADPEPYLLMGKIEIASPNPLPCVQEKLARFAQQAPAHALAQYFYAMAIWKQSGNGLAGAALDQVSSLLEKAITLDPHCSDALLQLGNLDALRGNYAAAIGLYNKAIVANPNLNEAHYRLAIAYDRVGDKVRARQEFQLHETLEKEQAAEVDRQRREIKQFVVETPSNAPASQNP